MFKEASRFLTSLKGKSPQSAAHTGTGVINGRRKSRKELELEARVRGRKVREWFAYLAACNEQNAPAYGVPDEILAAWDAAHRSGR
jgi:hypothetical protein